MAAKIVVFWIVVKIGTVKIPWFEGVGKRKFGPGRLSFIESLLYFLFY